MNNYIINELRKIVGPPRVSTTMEQRTHHAKDKSFHEAVIPDVVVWVKNAQEVSRVLKLANKHHIPVTPWGAGSSLQGNTIPVKKGIVLNMTLMSKVLQVIPDGFQVIVEPGIICDSLNEYLKPYNLFLPAFPGSSHIATIGGVIANNAGGMYAVKYGVIKDWVMELEVVLADGRIIHVGSKSIKSVSGYNLLNIFIGSSGTLGVITKATLKLLPIPETRMAVLVDFPTLTDVGQAVMDILHADIRPAALEHMDEEYIKVVNQAQQDIKLNLRDTLLIELHGMKETLLLQLKQLEKICKKNHCATYEEFRTPEACNRLWACRKGVRLAFYKMAPRTGILSAETGVPLPYVPEFIKKVKQLQKHYGIPMLNHGHVGDGNFHAWALYDMDDPQSLKKAELINEKLITYALSVGGTASGEHGIGISKKHFLALEHPTALPVMQAIKHVLDPHNILNPGKIFPEEL